MNSALYCEIKFSLSIIPVRTHTELGMILRKEFQGKGLEIRIFMIFSQVPISIKKKSFTLELYTERILDSVQFRCSLHCEEGESLWLFHGHRKKKIWPFPLFGCKSWSFVFGWLAVKSKICQELVLKTRRIRPRRFEFQF